MYTKSEILFIVALVLVLSSVEGSPIEEYSKSCEKVIGDDIYNISSPLSDPEIIAQEFLKSTVEKPAVFGEHLKLSEDEIMANETLMIAKLEVAEEGFNESSEFWPSRNFLDVRKNIEQSELFKIIQMMPKGAVLHTHGGSTASLNYLYEILTHIPNLYVCFVNETVRFRYFQTPCKDCEWKLFEKLRKEDPEVISKLRDYFTAPIKAINSEYNVSIARKDYGRMFNVVEGLILYRHAFETYVQRSLQEIWDDNVLYMEFRAPVYRVYELNGTVHEPIEAIRIFKRVVDKFVADHPGFIGAKYILSSDKLYDHGEFKRDLKIYTDFKRAFPGFAAGLNIPNVGDVDYPADAYVIQELREWSSDNFYLLSGESKWIGDVIDEESIDQILRHTIRIKHGSALAKDPKLMDIVKKKNIAIEVCPISNQVLGYVDDLRNHQAVYYFAKNHSVVISNDSPSFWGASGLSYDYYEAFLGIMPCNADLRSLKQLAINSIEFSAMTKQEKQAAFENWEKSWLKFVQELVDKYRLLMTKRLHNQKKEGFLKKKTV